MPRSAKPSFRERLGAARRRLSLITGSNGSGPTTAIVAVTLNCNARCTMCDIWQNRMKNELAPEELSVLPSTLRDINISGGEPFLRKDLPEIVSVLRRTCPDARLVISTNGFTPARIRDSVAQILEVDPHIAIRFSLDGLQAAHDRIRRIPDGFDKAVRSLEAVRDLGVRDLGVGFTVLDSNTAELAPVYDWCLERGLELSITVATDSPIFFGEDKATPRGEAGVVAEALRDVAARESRTLSPKRWMRGWFEGRLAEYVATGKRPLPCDAASGFFYLDSLGTVYGCHVRDLVMGNIREQGWDEIWSSTKASSARDESRGCDSCFMVCTSKSQIAKKLPWVVAEAGRDALLARIE